MTRPANTLVLVTLLASACASQGMVDDGTTVSHGRSFEGHLRNSAQLPPQGEGYVVPKRWVRRGNQHGTDELITMIVRVARRVHRETGEALGVADLSPKMGGPTPWHRSHQTGRDVDLLLFAVDRKGNPLPADAMVPFKEDGSSYTVDSHGKRRSKRYFDAERNWALIRAVLEEPTVEVQYIYVYEPLKQLMIEHALEAGEPNGIIEHASAVMEQPVDSSKHDDHIHVRIYCPESDRMFGCRDGWVRPWHKKLYKYGWEAFVSSAQYVPAAVQVAVLAI
jgi:penicillin-insensitive murein endopeptidase